MHGAGELLHPAAGVLALLVVLGTAVASGQCPNIHFLMMHAEQCLEPLTVPNNATLVGALTQETRARSCSQYNISLRCIDKLVKDCHGIERDLDFGSSIRLALRKGMGQLCEDESTFQRYLIHAHCYQQQEGESVRCMHRFSKAVHNATESEDEYGESIEPLCMSFDDLITCVNSAIKSCGKDAAELFDNLVRAQVPSQVSLMCKSNTEPLTKSTQRPSGCDSRPRPQVWISMCLWIVYIIVA